MPRIRITWKNDDGDVFSQKFSSYQQAEQFIKSHPAVSEYLKMADKKRQVAREEKEQFNLIKPKKDKPPPESFKRHAPGPEQMKAALKEYGSDGVPVSCWWGNEAYSGFATGFNYRSKTIPSVFSRG